MLSLLSQPVGERVTLALLHFLWQGAVISLLLELALRCVGGARPQPRYLLSLGAIGLMALCPVATWSVLPERPAESSSVLAMGGTGSLGADGPPVTSLRSGVLPEGESSLPESWFNGQTINSLLAAAQPYVLAIWLAGVLLLGGRLIAGYLGTLWMRNAKMPLPGAVAKRVAGIGQRLGIETIGRVFASSRVTEAIAVGWYRPIVLVPLSWLTELPPEAVEAVVAHELAHIRRWDLWATLLQRLVESLLFYHPAVWWISQRVSLERELCCDDLAVMATGKRLVYAKSLEALGKRVSGGGSLVLAASFRGEADMGLLVRVRHVLGLRPQSQPGGGWLAGLAAIGVAAAIWGAPVALSALADEERETGSSREAKSQKARFGIGVHSEAGLNGTVLLDALDFEIALKDEEEDDKPEARERGDRERPRPERGPVESEEESDDARPRREGDERGGRPAPPPRPQPPLPPRRAERDDRGRGDDGPRVSREEEMFQLLLKMKGEMEDMRREIRELRRSQFEDHPRPRDGAGPGRPMPRDGERPLKGPRDGEGFGVGPRDGEGPGKPGPREGEGARRPGPRDGERPPGIGPRDGERPPGIGPRDGEGPRKPGPRDGDGAKRPGPRDGERPPGIGPRDGEGPPRGPREGDEGGRPGARLEF